MTVSYTRNLWHYGLDWARSVLCDRYMLDWGRSVLCDRYMLDWARSVLCDRYMLDWARSVLCNRYMLDWARSVLCDRYMIDWARSVLCDRYMLDWARSVLCDRYMKVVERESSREESVLPGVPQGTVLNHSSFFATSMIYLTVSPQKSIFSLTIVFIFRTKNDHLKSQDTGKLAIWATTWGMCFNAKKCTQHNKIKANHHISINWTVHTSESLGKPISWNYDLR
jgi:hypothetical protein